MDRFQEKSLDFDSDGYRVIKSPRTLFFRHQIQVMECFGNLTCLAKNG